MHIVCQLVNVGLVMVFVLVRVAFVTLFERKILGLSQLRKGPNKAAFAGLAQPFRDAIKLFIKLTVPPVVANKKLFLVAPGVSMVVVLLLFLRMAFFLERFSGRMTIIMLYLLLSLNVFPMIISGWASNSKYSLLGRMRIVAQTISYEICLALVLMFYMVSFSSIRRAGVLLDNGPLAKALFLIPLHVILVIRCVAETNRTPFDFAEGERELVSGFNVEFGRGLFALVFIREYASIILIGAMVLLVLSPENRVLTGCGVVSRAVFFWVWFRTTYPRIRYDKLIGLA